MKPHVCVCVREFVCVSRITAARIDPAHPSGVIISFSMSTSMSPESSELATICLPSSSTSVEDRRLLTRTSLLAQRLVRLQACRDQCAPVKRRKREMIPADKKDATYWHKRRKNNEAAKRSREKRKFNDLLLGDQLMALSEENAQLRAQMFNLHYHTNINMEKHKPVSPSLLSLSLSPVPTHSPALLQTGLWSPIAAVRQQEAATHQFETSVPCFSSSGVGFNHLNHHYLIPRSEPLPISRGGVLGGRRSVEMNAQQQVSSSDDATSHRLSSMPTFLPAPDAFQHASAIPYPHQNWVVPHLNQAAACNSNLLPWRSSYLAKPTAFPGLPVGRPGQGVGVEEHLQRGLMSRFSTAP